MKRHVVVGLVGALVLVAAACGGDDDGGATSTSAGSGSDQSSLPEQIAIGVPLDTSGSAGAAPAGLAQLAGIELAVEEINETGFLGDTEIVLDVVDTRNDKQAAVEAVLGFVNEQVDAVVGFSLTPSFMAAGPQLQQAGIPTMTAGLAAPGVTEVGDYIFRIFPNGNEAFPDGDVEVATAFEAETAAYLTQSDAATAAGLAPARKAALEAAGVETVSEQTFASSDTDLRAQLTAIDEADPDLLIASLTAGPQSILYLQAAEVGLDAQIIGSTGVTAEVLEQAGDAMQCAIYATPWTPQSTEGSNPHFLERWESNGEGEPNVFNAYGYGAMWSMAEAFKAAGSVDGAEVRDALASLEEVDTPIGTVNYQNERNAGVEVTMLQVQGSEEVLWDPEGTCQR